MKKQRIYIQPSCLVIPLGLLLNNNNSWGGDQGIVGFGIGTVDAGMGQGKEASISDSDDPIWED